MSDCLPEFASESNAARSKARPDVDVVDLVDESVAVFGPRHACYGLEHRGGTPLRLEA